MWDLIPWPGTNPGPLHWECGVLATVLPVKSLERLLKCRHGSLLQTIDLEFGSKMYILRAPRWWRFKYKHYTLKTEIEKVLNNKKSLEPFASRRGFAQLAMRQGTVQPQGTDSYDHWRQVGDTNDVCLEHWRGCILSEGSRELSARQLASWGKVDSAFPDFWFFQEKVEIYIFMQKLLIFQS